MRRNAPEFVKFVFQWKNLFHNIFAKSSRGSSKEETSLVIGNELTFKVDLRYFTQMPPLRFISVVVRKVSVFRSFPNVSSHCFNVANVFQTDLLQNYPLVTFITK